MNKQDTIANILVLIFYAVVVLVIIFMTANGMLEKTAPYCVPVYTIDIHGTLVYDGYYMSELALEDHEEIECQN